MISPTPTSDFRLHNYTVACASFVVRERGGDVGGTSRNNVQEMGVELTGILRRASTTAAGSQVFVFTSVNGTTDRNRGKTRAQRGM